MTQIHQLYTFHPFYQILFCVSISPSTYYFSWAILKYVGDIVPLPLISSVPNFLICWEQDFLLHNHSSIITIRKLNTDTKLIHSLYLSSVSCSSNILFCYFSPVQDQILHLISHPLVSFVLENFPSLSLYSFILTFFKGAPAGCFLEYGFIWRDAGSFSGWCLRGHLMSLRRTHFWCPWPWSLG